MLFQAIKADSDMPPTMATTGIMKGLENMVVSFDSGVGNCADRICQITRGDSQL